MGKTDNLESIKIVLFLHFFEQGESHVGDITKKYTGVKNIDDGVGTVVLYLK